LTKICQLNQVGTERNIRRQVYKVVQWMRSKSSSGQTCREDVLHNIRFISADRILDIGCNDGEYTLDIAKTMGAKDICGIDIDGDAVLKCRIKGIKAVVGSIDGTKLPFENSSFDCCTCIQVLEHISDTDRFVDEVYRILRPQGYFVVATPNLAAWNHILSLILGFQPTATYISDRTLWLGNPLMGKEGTPRSIPTKGHIRVFTCCSLTAFLEHNGFNIVICIGSGYLGLPKGLGRLMSAIDRRHSTN
jgi:2-polyprenyl-3-methyl-5-hydroxy-6-metoxy-1,4-benzoquinol methylase